MSRANPRSVLERPYRDLAGAGARGLGRTKYWLYFNILNLRKRFGSRRLLSVTHIPNLMLYKKRAQQRGSITKRSRAKKVKKILDRRNRFPDRPWTPQRRSRRYWRQRSRRKARFNMGARKKFLQTYVTSLRFVKSPSRLVRPNFNLTSISENSLESRMDLSRDDVQRKAFSSTKWNRLSLSIRRIRRSSGQPKRPRTKTPPRLLNNYFHIKKSFQVANSVRSQPNFSYEPLIDRRMYFESPNSLKFTPLFASLFSRFSSLQPRFFKCPMYHPTFPVNLNFYSRYNTPFIQTNKLYTTV
jgi:hypothetical protein